MSPPKKCYHLVLTVLFLALGRYLGNPVADNCPDLVPCWCSERVKGPSLDCMYAFLVDIPDFGNDAENFTILVLTGNDIDLSRPDNIKFLRNFRNLTELELDKNTPIGDSVVLKDYMFNDLGLTKLTRLSLAECGISDINPKAFQGLTKLMILDLSGNSLNTVPEALLVLHTLRDLYLSGNIITTLEKDSFSSLTKIEFIKLSENIIGSMDNDTFLPMKHSLNEIYLSDNRLSTIPPNAFQNIKCLFKLYLSGNGIQEMPDGAFNGSMIEILLLDNNKIDWTHSRNWFDGLEGSLRLLDISSMNSTSLPVTSLRHLRSLRRLVARNISMTLIGSKAFRGLPDKINIDLSNNKIEGGSHTALSDSPKDLSLNLKNNKIRSVSFLRAEKPCALREVKLSKNPIECNCDVFEIIYSGYFRSITGDCFDESGVTSPLNSEFPEYLTETCNVTASLVTCHGGKPNAGPDTSVGPNAAVDFHYRSSAPFIVCCLLFFIRRVQ